MEGPVYAMMLVTGLGGAVLPAVSAAAAAPRVIAPGGIARASIKDL
jgi:hypothetical protein